MKINSDYRDLLKSLNAGHVRYLVHTEPYCTKDLDIWVDSSTMTSEYWNRRNGWLEQ